MRVKIDVTPLLGPPTGIHQATAGMVEALAARADVDAAGYVLSARATARQVEEAGSRLGIDVALSRAPAGICHRCWARADRPALSRLVGDADVVHGINYTAPPGDRRLITVHDLSPVTHPQWCSAAVKRMGAALIRAVERGTHVHVTTQATAAAAADRLGAPPSRLHVVPIGLRAVAPGDAAAARRVVGAERFVLALGTTEARKGLLALPPAIAGLPADVKLVVAGPVGGDEAALAAAVENCGASGRFVRLVDVDDKRKADLLHGATVLAYPSLMEGFGLPPLEAALAGTPVVATAVGALPDLLEPEIELVPDADRDAFADRLAAAVAEPRPVPPQVQTRIARLTWTRAAQQMVDVYRAVIDAG